MSASHNLADAKSFSLVPSNKNDLYNIHFTK